MTTTADVVVIGGGIAGLSAGWALSTDLEVVVLEQERQLASHATGRSAAVISETYGPKSVCALASQSRPFLSQAPGPFSPVPLLQPQGMLWVSNKSDSLVEIASLASEIGAWHERMLPERACSFVNVLRRDWVEDALLEPGAMSIDVAALVEGYRSGLLRRKGEIRIARPAIRVAPIGRFWAVEHQHGTIHCEVVVNAAGAWADEVAVTAGLERLDLQPFRRTAFVFPVHNPEAADWPLVMDQGGRFYFEPEGDGLLASPAEETPCEPHDARADEMAMARAVDALAAATTLRIGGLRAQWAGLRTFAPDRLPVVGFDPGADGFFWLAGQGGAGIKTAPALAALTHALVTGTDKHGVPGDATIDPDDLAPARLLG